MAIAFESITSDTGSGGWTLTKPTGLSAGDMLMMIYETYDSGVRTPNIPTGWTRFEVQAASSFSQGELGAQYKIADSSDAATSNFSWTCPAADHVAFLLRISDAANIEPQSSSQYQENSNATTSISGFTPTHPKTLLIGAVATSGTTVSGYSIATDNPTWTERGEDTSGFRTNLAVATGTRDSSNATGSFSFTRTGTDGVGAMLIAVFEPADTTGTHSHIAVNPVVNSGSGTSGVNASLSHLSISPTINSPTATGTAPTNWTNQSRSSTTWTNQTKNG